MQAPRSSGWRRNGAKSSGLKAEKFSTSIARVLDSSKGRGSLKCFDFAEAARQMGQPKLAKPYTRV